MRRIAAGPRGDVRLVMVRDDAVTLERLRDALQSEDIRSARRIGHRGRRRTHLLGRALLRLLVSEITDTPSARVRLRVRRDRRPLHRTTDRRRLALSLTHAGGWVIAAAARGAGAGRALGIDVESRDRTLAPRTQGRLAWHEAPEAGIRDWCVGEAALKADGRGISALSRLRRQSRGRAPVRLYLDDRRPGRVVAYPLAGLPRGLVGAIALAPRLGRPGRGGTQDPSR